jgi:MoxR-like ATPase
VELAMTTTFEAFESLNQYLSTQIIGQKQLINRLLIALLADGHLIVEGAPGLAKTRAINALSKGIEVSFHRVQFTPDLLPSDITGTEIYRPQTTSFHFEKGPLFHHLILADEINRAPAKVQSALLEAMAERQITVGKQTYPLSDLFLVMATQNPLEQEGTYPLPEAHLDRFLMHVMVDFPTAEEEAQILALTREETKQDKIAAPKPISQETVFEARKAIMDLYLAPKLEQYMIELVMASRSPERYDDNLARYIAAGLSPRGTIALDRAARAHAWLAGRDYVGPEDIQNIAPDVLRHRLWLSYEAEAEGLSANDVVYQIIDKVALP